MKLKYKRIIIFITMFTMCIGLVTLSISSPSSNSTKSSKHSDQSNTKKPIHTNPDEDSTNQPDSNTPQATKNIHTNDPLIGTGSAVTSSPSNIPSNPNTSTLEWETHPEVNELVTQYFNACINLDLTALEPLVSNINKVDLEKLKTKYNVLERVENIECYTITQPDTENFLVYITSDWKIKGVDTLAPSLDFLYIYKKADGSYCVYYDELDEKTQEFISSVDKSQEVSDLIHKVNLKYQEVLTTDKSLKELDSKLEETNEPTETNAPENTESTTP